MKAGSLDQRISIETPVAVEDALGQDARAWLPLADVWAEAKEQLGREFLAGDYKAEEKVAFRIRWRAVDSAARVVWNARNYRIESTTGTRRSGELWLHCVSDGGEN